MAMSGLKLTMAASSIHPHKLFRHVTTSSHSPSPSFPRTSSKPTSSLSLFPSPNITTTTPTWWRITTPCAHLSLAAHVSHPLRDKTLPCTPPLLKCFSSSSTPPPPAHSHAHKSGFSGSDTDRRSPSGSGLVADMDSEDSKAVNGDWYCNRPPPPPPGMQPQQSSSKLLTLPTILTIGRVAAVPILICTFYVDSWWGRTATTSIFIAAAITDWLDGYIARKMRLSSVFGAFLDPVADKLMVAATLVLLCTKPLETSMFGQAPWLLTVPAIAIIGREITMSAVREWAASQNPKLLEAVAVNNLGKWKTASQMIALTILLATRDSSIAGPGVLVTSGVALLYMSAGLSLWSLVVYMGKIWKVLLK